VSVKEPSKMRAAALLVLAVLPCILAESDDSQNKCSLGSSGIVAKWIDMNSECVAAVKEQVREEFKASMAYLGMAAHFSKYDVNRPGFAEHFFKSAGEEREHGIKLLEYLSMRGSLDHFADILKEINSFPTNVVITSGADALHKALELEAFVTKSILNLISKCEGDDPAAPNAQGKPVDWKTHQKDGKLINDYHFVDYLTGVYLEEQYHGQRELAGMISTLNKMMKSHGDLGEFLFDKKLLG